MTEPSFEHLTSMLPTQTDTCTATLLSTSVHTLLSSSLETISQLPKVGNIFTRSEPPLALKLVIIIGHMRANPSVPAAPAGKCKQNQTPFLQSLLRSTHNAMPSTSRKRRLLTEISNEIENRNARALFSDSNLPSCPSSNLRLGRQGLHVVHRVGSRIYAKNIAGVMLPKVVHEPHVVPLESSHPRFKTRDVGLSLRGWWCHGMLRY